ncbi:MAG: hypothetical protein HRU19_20255 [Pseudobacteriovorax sp.]|nr:hypothetical protein [Pseudobacteriovorax sp.]
MKQLLLLTATFWLSLDLLAISGKLDITNKQGKRTGVCTDTVVFLEFEGDPNESPQSVSMSAKDRTFIPSILPIRVGTTVEFPNQDTILHNVFSLSKTKKFDLGLYRKSEGKPVTFDQAGLVKVFCNIHAEMVGHILVLENKYFARGLDDCTFSLPTPKDGTYKISVWYKKGRGSSQSIDVKNGKIVAVEGNSSSSLTLSIKHKRDRLRPHKNKSGKTYKKAY